MKIIDLHCDTISLLKKNKGSLFKNEGQYDLERAQATGVFLQFFAMFTQPADPNTTLRQVMMQVETFHRVLDENASGIYHLKKAQDLQAADHHNKLAAVLHLEGAECLGKDLEILHYLYRIGLRSIGLTWNYRNQFADGVSEGIAGGGLSKLGRQLVGEMEQLGMLLDLAHISYNSYFDALDHYHKPFLVTHANAYALCPSRRNLKDEQLKALQAHGGLIGITQVADFVHEEHPDMQSMVDHMVYIGELIGIEHVALGSDFDGADHMVIQDVSGYGNLPEALLKRGFSEKEIELVLYKNALSIIEQVLL